MGEFHPASAERIPTFRVEGTYLFKHYFEESVFEEIAEYYDRYDHRFEVPEGAFDAVREELAEAGYALVEADPEEFAVVKRKYTEHPDVLFRGSVFQRNAGNFNVFVMKDRDARRRAVEAGARRPD